MVKGECDPRNFSELGFCARETYVNNVVKYEVQVDRTCKLVTTPRVGWIGLVTLAIEQWHLS